MKSFRLTPRSTATAGIQECIDALPASGGVVELASGEFHLHRPILLRSRVTLRGQGSSTVLTVVKQHLTPLAADTPVAPTSVEVVDSGPLQCGDAVMLMEIYLPCRGRNFGYNARLLEIDQVKGHTLHGRVLYGPNACCYRTREDAFVVRAFPAILVCEASDVRIEAMTIDGCDEPLPRMGERQIEDFMFASVLIHQARRCRLRDLHIQRWPGDGICAGGDISDVDVSHCVVEHCRGNGMHTGGNVQGGQWTHNVSRYNDRGFMFCQGNRHVILANNLIHHNRQDGIWGLDAADQYCIVAHNICHHNGWHGIEAHGSVGNVIQGNICRNNSQAQPGQYAGISIRSHRDNVVSHNLCADDQSTPTQRIGLHTDPPFTSP